MIQIPNIIVIDDILDDRTFQLNKNIIPNLKFKDVESQGYTYKDILEVNDDLLIYRQLEQKLNMKIKNKYNFFRAYKDSPKYRHPMWIHSDVLFADYIAIHFVQSSEFPQDDGVSFWKHKKLDIYGINPGQFDDYDVNLIQEDSLHPDKWEIHKRVEFKENRIVVAPANCFHSKTSYGNYGEYLGDCRIVQVLFFNEDV